MKNIIHAIFLISIIAFITLGIINRDSFFSQPPSFTTIPEVQSLGFDDQVLEATSSHKAAVITPHEFTVSAPPKKKYAQKYLVVFLNKKILGAIDGKKYAYTFYNINLPKDVTKGKSKKGDRLVPLGDYYILQHDLRGNSMFLTLNYPNAKDAEKGYKAGLISEKEYNAIVSAQKKRVLPPFNTALGGPVVIRGDGVPGKNTAGNIGIPSDAMKKIWEFAKKGTVVRILP